MRAVDALNAMRKFDVANLPDIVGEGGLVVIAPHQDDESLACGGLIAEACATGHQVRVIFVSDGTGSHPRSRAFPRARLRAVRENEARQAALALGLHPCHLDFLRLPDRFVPCEGAAARAAVARIVDCARSINASALFVSWRHDPHCDHQASFQLAREAQQYLDVALYEYSVWGVSLKASEPVSAVTAGFRLPVARHRARKQRAIQAHRSQLTAMIADDPTGFRLSEADLARFSTPFEAFIASRP